MNDGPQGFRDDDNPGSSTAWPSGLTMAASWDRVAMERWGSGMAKEFFAKGSNIQLGPGLCVARVPRNGRNFEYLSGEDPMLGYHLVGPVIKGIQGEGVIANAKHYIMNDQETNRNSVSETVDERTRFQMYYPPFAGALDADVGSIMCSCVRRPLLE
jgi:beta-glucosidase